MSHDDPFSLSPLGNSTLSSGFGLGVAAFDDDFAANDFDDDPPPAGPSPAMHTPQMPSLLISAES